MADTTKKLPTLSDSDLAAMIASEDEYIRMRKREATKPPTKDIFYAGFHFGVAHARKQMAQGTPAPALQSVPEDGGDDEVEGGDGD